MSLRKLRKLRKLTRFLVLLVNEWTPQRHHIDFLNRSINLAVAKDSDWLFENNTCKKNKK